jgi:hypothetical protein
MVRAAREALVAAWPRIMRQPSNRTQALARGERRYAGAKAAEQAERARQLGQPSAPTFTRTWVVVAAALEVADSGRT